MSPKPSHDALIHCEHCGEDYSATYRRCPFCGERNDPRRVTPRNDPTSSSRYVPMPPAAKPAASSRNNEEELDDGYVFDGQDAFDEEPEEEYYAPRPKGGKRLAPKQPGRFDPPPVHWPHRGGAGHRVHLHLSPAPRQPGPQCGGVGAGVCGAHHAAHYHPHPRRDPAL